MKNTFKSLTIIAMLGTITVSCQKESFFEPQCPVAEIGTMYRVHYTINGVPFQETLVGEHAWSDFLHRMLAMAERGWDVCVSNGANTCHIIASKDVVTYSTENYDDAYSWCEKMLQSGYTVRMKFDPEKKVYNCIALK